MMRQQQQQGGEEVICPYQEPKRVAQLPVEVLHRCLLWSTAPELARCARAGNRSFTEKVTSDDFWEEIVLRDFPKKKKNLTAKLPHYCPHWKEAYKLLKTRSQNVQVLVTGYQGSGVSTLVERLQFDLDGYDERTMDKIHRRAAEINGGDSDKFAFAYHMDNLESILCIERGMTIASHIKEFFTLRYHFTFADPPGNRDFIRNHIGASSHQVAMILFPINAELSMTLAKSEKEREQIQRIRRHVHLLKFIGVKQLIVGITKMDIPVGVEVGEEQPHQGNVAEAESYSEERFLKVAAEAKRLLLHEGWSNTEVEKEIPVIPISARVGDNILSKSADTMPWWGGVTIELSEPSTSQRTPEDGPRSSSCVVVECLQDALDAMVTVPPPNREGPLRAPVGKVITSIKGIECVVTSRLEQGVLNSGEEVIFLPTHTTENPCVGKVSSIEMHHKEHAQVGAGDNVGLLINGLPKGNMPRYGDLMVLHKPGATNDHVRPCRSFTVQATILGVPVAPRGASAIGPGFTPICHVSTQCAACSLSRINFKVGRKSTGGQKVQHPEFVERGDLAELVFKPGGSRPLVVEDFQSGCEVLSRVAMRERDGNSSWCILGKIVQVEY